MFVLFHLMSLAPLQIINIASLLKLLISLSAIDVKVLFLAAGITVPVTSYDFPTKFAISTVQPQAWLSPITIIFFYFCFNMQEACGFCLVLLSRECFLMAKSLILVVTVFLLKYVT